MLRSPDTSPEAHQVQLAAWRAMSPGRKIELAAEMSEDMFTMAAEGVRRRHPDYDEHQVEWAMRRMRLGDDLLRRVWPDGPLLDA